MVIIPRSEDCSSLGNDRKSEILLVVGNNFVGLMTSQMKVIRMKIMMQVPEYIIIFYNITTLVTSWLRGDDAIAAVVSL